MLPAILAAVSQTGKSNKQIAAACDRTAPHITEWFSGRCHIPLRMRKRVSDAIGAEVDWQAYEAEFQAAQVARKGRAPALPDDPAPAPAPDMPRPAPQMPQKRPSAVVAAPPTRKPETRPQAPSSAPSGNGGILGFLKTKPATDEKGFFGFD